jgi:pyridoxine/pyridoxamine 5'-phosphate oxidase
MKIIPVVRRALLREIDEEEEDIQYWLSRPPHERIAAVTSLISKSLEPGQRMDKTIVIRRKLHP